MKLQLTVPCLVASLAFYGFVSSSAEAQSTRFECIPEGTGWATIAVAPSGRKTPPLISWKSTFFKDFPPEKRCRMVNQKLAQAVQENGGKVAGIGIRSEVGVFCYLVSGQTSCNSRNHLMNYTPGNYKNPGEALNALLAKIMAPYDKSVPAVQSLISLPSRDPDPCIKINTCSAVERDFGKALEFSIRSADDEI